MNILDVALAGRIAAGGGGSGTDNYNDLSNLPQINGETLAGNKTAENLGLQDALTFDSTPTEDSTNPVESGGVYNALAGKQDNLTFDDDPTENSTNPVKSGGVYSALAGKQDNLTFDGVYNASTNKAATESTVTNAIAELDVSALSVDADETISSISETDGKISVTKQDIAIASNQVAAMAGYTKPSSAPANPAIQTTDTANQAFGKLEFKADTNQTNILSVQNGLVDVINNGAKNIIYYDGFPKTEAGMTFSIDTDGGLIVNGTCSVTGDTSAWIYGMYANVEQGVEYSLIDVANGSEGGAGAYAFVADTDIFGDSRTLYEYETHYTAAITKKATITLRLTNGITYTNKKFKCVICPKSLYNINPDYQPFALPNYDLTRLEAEDRAALAEEIDAGAKNKFDLPSLETLKASNSSGTWSNNVYTLNNVTFTVDTTNKTISTSGTASAQTTFIIESINPASTKYSGLILSGCPSGGNYDTGYSLYTTGTSSSTLESDTGEGVLIGTTAIRYVGILCRNGTNMSGKVFKPMICTKAAFGVSNKFVPYRPNYDLVCNSVVDLNDMISSFTVNSYKPVTIKLRRDGSFAMLMFGFVQTIGQVHWYVQSPLTGDALSVIDAITGSAVSQSVITFNYNYSTATLTISASTPGNCNFVLIRSAY